jgi:phosphohistidine phosphatase
MQARDVLDLLGGVGVEGPLLLVGHEPDLSGIVAQLTGGRVDLKKGGLAILRLSAGGAELVLLLRPAELALIADIAVAGV